MYPRMDLSDQLPVFIRSMFDTKIRKSLIAELSLLSEEQAKALGITEGNVNSFFEKTNGGFLISGIFR